VTSVSLRLPKVCYEDLREDGLKGIRATPIGRNIKRWYTNDWTEFRGLM